MKFFAQFSLHFLLALSVTSVVSQGQTGDVAVKSGPMIGHVSMRSAQLWIQSNGPMEVQAKYRVKGDDEWITPQPRRLRRREPLLPI